MKIGVDLSALNFKYIGGIVERAVCNNIINALKDITGKE